MTGGERDEGSRNAHGAAPPRASGPEWDTTASGAACVPNIGARERKKRLVFGYVAWGLTAVGLIALLVTDAPRVWRLALFLPLWMGGVGFFQHREKT